MNKNPQTHSAKGNRTTLFMFFTLLIIGVVACTKQPSNYPIHGDYFIYGHTGGFTTPEARTTYYLVNSGQFRKDMTQRHQAPPVQISQFNFHYRFSNTEYNTVADLPGTIPAKMLAMNGQSIGTELPDAGAIDIRASINGKTYKWQVEAMLDSVDTTIQRFMDRCRTSFP
jgi:hypothetical protein